MKKEKTMARTKTITSIEQEIEKTKESLAKIQVKYDILGEKLFELHQQKYEYETKQIMEAYSKSGKSYRELMTFLGV